MKPSSGELNWVRRIKLCQELAIRPSRWLVKRRCRQLNVRLTVDDLAPGRSYVIAANHQSRLDPFMITAALPLPLWNRLIPFRFFAHNGLFWPPLRQILLGLGCFPARSHSRYPSGLEFAAGAMKLGETVFIFPEGTRSRPGQRPARRGVAALAEMPGVMIIPAHVNWYRGGWRRRFDLTIGSPFSAAGLSAEAIMERIYSL